MKMYDIIRNWEHKGSIIFNTLRLRLMFYRNIHFSGLEDIHITTQIYGRMNGNVWLGNRIAMCKHCSLVSVGGNLKIGDYCYFNDNCSVVCHEKIDIGPNCKFGPNTCIYDHDHSFGYEGVKTGYETSPVIIGRNCWVGANVTILRGTNIGDGCIIGAGTVVKGNIPAHSIVKNNRELKITKIKEK